MTDISTVLPHFSTNPFSTLIPPLERAGISTAELLALDAIDIARKAQIPIPAVTKLVDALVEALHVEVQEKPSPKCTAISLLDPILDAVLAGGPKTGYLTEFVGERCVLHPSILKS